MKYVRFIAKGYTGYGIVEGQHIFPIDGTPYQHYSIIRQPIPIEEVRLLSPCQPSKAICIGLNYRDHAEEIGIPIPSSPVVFIKPSNTVIGPYDAIRYPALSHRVDYEAELAIVIGKEASHIALNEVNHYILGYTCANDVTARDLQPKDGQWTIAKGFDTFLPLGPMITDEIDPTDVTITSRLNAELRQHSNTRNLIFDYAFLVSYLSSIMTLYPGDVILTGTPAKIGPMEVGDTIEIEISGIGTLQNTVQE